MKKWSLVIIISFVFCIFSLNTLAVAADEKKEKKEESALAGISIETQAVGNTRPSKVDAWYQPETKKLVGVFGGAGRWSDGYQYVYGGPTFKLIKWVTIGVGGGVEQAALGEDNRRVYFRGAGFAEVNIGKFNAFALFEQGGTGPWYKITADYQITEKIFAGGLFEANIGIGPRLGYNLGKGYKVWAAIARDLNDRSYTPIFAINYTF